MIDPPNLSRLGLGCGRIGSFNNPQSLRDSEALVRAALDMGVTVFDTSNIYGQGDSEAVIGGALAGGGRDRAFVLTKGGRRFSAKICALLWAKPMVRPLLARRQQGGGITARRSEELGVDWRPEALMRSLEASLRRLRTDCVDGFVLHSPSAAIVADPAVGAALAMMRSQGKARYVGVSCDDLATVEAALAMPAVTLLELPGDVIAAAGHLTEDIRRRGIVVIAREVIRQRPDLPPAQAVLAGLDDPMVRCALVGTTNIAHLAELAGGIA